MKPSIQEQLQGTCRILESVVAPCVNDPLARTILDGLLANLRMLTDALPAVAGFLRHDNEASARLLRLLGDSADPALAARLAQALEQAPPDAADTAALDARNGQLRELLALAVCRDDLSADQHRAIVEHMSERASRMPMRYVSTAPSLSPNTKT